MTLKDSLVLKFLAIQLLLVFAISTGFNTVYYTWKRFSHTLIIILILIFLAGAGLNFILYFKNISDFYKTKQATSENKPSIPAKIIGITISLLASLATAIFSYYSTASLYVNSVHIHMFTVIFCALAAGFVTFALLTGDTIAQIETICKNLFRKSASKAKHEKISEAKIILTIIFSLGTAGLIWTSYLSFIKVGMPVAFAIILAMGLSIAEFAFIYSSAKNTINKIKENSLKKNMLFVFLCLVPALINGIANGLLDGFGCPGPLGIVLAICGTILSVSIMMESLADQAKVKDKFTFKKLFASIITVMPTSKQMLATFFSAASMISIMLLLQFNVPAMAVWLPILILSNIFSARCFVFFGLGRKSESLSVSIKGFFGIETRRGGDHVPVPEV